MRNKIIGIALVLCVLLASWFWTSDDGGTKTADNSSGTSLQTKEELWSDEIYEPVPENDGTAEPQKTAENNIREEKQPTVQESTENTVVAEMPSVPETVDAAVVAEEKTEEQPIKEDKKNVCILSVQCKTVLANKDKLKDEKLELIPGDGVILAETEVEITPGESVFDVLLREMRKNKIHLEFSETPMYKSAYIEGINNLYQFDCGEMSGWVYRVNGQVQNVGCSRCFLQPGDRVEWVYTCNLGRDL